MLTWIALLALFLFSGATYAFGRRKAQAMAARGKPGALHSLPGYHGGYVALWAGLPAALIVLAAALFGGRMEAALLRADSPAAVQALTDHGQAVFFDDARAMAHGTQASETIYEGDLRTAIEDKAVQAKRLQQLIQYGALAAGVVVGLAGLAIAYPRISPTFRARNRVEGWIAVLFIACAVTAILTTVGIVASLVWESWRFFQSVPPLDFLLGTAWDPQIAMRSDQYASKGAFGAVPLFAGTFLIMLIAMLVAAPIGLYSAIYLSEYARPLTRGVVKPLLEILAGVPTVVYGFFAALTVGPIFREGFNNLGGLLVGGPLNGLGIYLSQVQNQMALVAGAVMGIMLIPFVSSLSDDIMNAVPQSLRDGSLAMGATRSETVKQVVLPAALPGIMAALLLAVSRAIGETMIVTMAAGLQAKTTLNPLDTVTTVTVQIVTLLTGDQEFDSPKTLSAFGLGLTLFVVTFILNVIALRIVQKYREQYD
ncbi:MAG: phosphate ABC transporter permease subunit PstC [Phenylobacterium sp.]|uniref:phosphate ABC transporter permease subunit PstC n=1 Tax=Phenylobacterium sp. TaxID=1871053 RepID=UPI001B3F7498|nr:phosphate ABC transporter permease subunit PstC [Phenylobacterium sp.]MBP7648326.1 phosphate ABC transporter permease subunit PstC [Phenylobacterium sp.]MBP7817883.1 phosphate ABC transporter permease subunit PstC [Phenylobacterium sp.]MBP9229961.1 phosphate ABC transporter permease subunit PstC [Phenylobacterium sp.]MBP9755231.1 phosphate ABC transporter permease subunit PstC [Phenylobacterium sp.]